MSITTDTIPADKPFNIGAGKRPDAASMCSNEQFKVCRSSDPGTDSGESHIRLSATRKTGTDDTVTDTGQERSRHGPAPTGDQCRIISGGARSRYKIYSKTDTNNPASYATAVKCIRLHVFSALITD